MGFSREKYWSGLPFPSPGDLPNPRIKLTSPSLAGGFFTTKPTEKPKIFTSWPIIESDLDLINRERNKSLNGLYQVEGQILAKMHNLYQRSSVWTGAYSATSEASLETLDTPDF